jgi:DNA polymerase-3 subunit delta
MPKWDPAYLIHGDDHGRIAERRAKLRALAEAESGPGGVEVFEGDACTAETIVGALTAMTFAMGRRFVIADGVERWKEAQAEEVAAALKGIDPETMTVVFFGREEGRAKIPAALAKAVTSLGGRVNAEVSVKPWELPKWATQQASALQLRLDPDAARALVAQVGDRQQRLLRELEKLALEYGPGATIGLDEVEASTAASAERKVWSLADAIVAGDQAMSARILLELREQGERLPGLLHALVRRLRDALDASEALAAGAAASDVRSKQRGGKEAVARFMKAVTSREPAAFRRALERMADLEVESRGGGETVADEDTAAIRAVLASAGR